MTTYTAIPNADVDVDSPLSTALITALRDNVLAIQEGDATAPRIDSINAMDHQGVEGAIGTYMLAMGNNSTNTTFDFGDTVAGSQLDPVGLSGDTALTDFHVSVDKFTVSATAPAGTWQCMGHGISDEKNEGQRYGENDAGNGWWHAPRWFPWRWYARRRNAAWWTSSGWRKIPVLNLIRSPF